MVQVACLCAAWCDACRQYRAVFDGVAQRFGGGQFVWLDIEAREDLVGELELETFPTILVARGAQVAFFGPVLPQAETLARLVRAYALEAPPEGPPLEGGMAGEALPLLGRLRDAGVFA